jgi:hypothetical protein
LNASRLPSNRTIPRQRHEEKILQKTFTFAGGTLTPTCARFIKTLSSVERNVRSAYKNERGGRYHQHASARHIVRAFGVR